MKKSTLFILSFILWINSFSQIVFDVLSNSCDTNVVGTFPFEYAGELDGSSTDWGCPDITNPANAVQGCLVLVNDGSSGTTTFGTPAITVNNSVLGCDSTNWTQDLTGKIAIIFRGICNFSLKAYNAQKRGAIGVVIINHTGSPIPMSGGAFGTLVTIPVIQIGRADGDELLTCLDTTCNGIVGFIGNKVGYYANNMGTDKADVLMPENLSTPKHLAPNGTVFPVDLGLFAYNLGLNIQNNVTASVVISLNSSIVYSQTSLPINFNAPLGGVVDTQFIDLGTYAPSNWAEGTYIVSYTLNNAVDDYLEDNTFSYEFKITDGNTGFYSKSRTDVNGVPIATSYYMPEATILEFEFKICILYETKNDFYGYNYSMDGLNFSCEPKGYNLDSEIIFIKAYQWNDVFTDLNSPPTFNNFLLVGQGMYTYGIGSGMSGQNIYVPFDSTIIPVLNQRYLLCVDSYSDSLKIGFDEGIDYKATVNHYLQPIAPVYAGEWDALYSYNWYLDGYGSGIIPAISVKMNVSTGINETIKESTLYPYPNPVTNLLTVPIRKKVEGKVSIEVFDLTGKLVLSENNTIGNEALKINLASISNGAYLFKLTFANGTSDQYKISVNR